MEQNIGDIDRFIRLTSGFYLLGIGIRKSSDLLMITGSMKIAEGLTRWCPVLHMLKRNTMGNKLTGEQKMPQDPVDTQIPVT